MALFSHIQKVLWPSQNQGDEDDQESNDDRESECQQKSKGQEVEGKIVVPPNLCTSLAINDDTQLYATYAQYTDRLSNEIVYSSVPIEMRNDPWIIRIGFKDRPGILARLTNLFHHLDINIHFARTFISDSGKYLNVHFHVDLALYDSPLDGDVEARKSNRIMRLRGLETLIVGTFIEEILFLRRDRPFISIYRNTPIYDTFRNHVHIGGWQTETSLLSLSNKHLNWIRESFMQQFRGVREDDLSRENARVIMLADVESQALRVVVFYENLGFRHLRVVGRSFPGGISTFARALRQKGYNILHLHARDKDRSSEDDHRDDPADDLFSRDRWGINDLLVHPISKPSEVYERLTTPSNVTEDEKRLEGLDEKVYQEVNEAIEALKSGAEGDDGRGRKYGFEVHQPGTLTENLFRRANRYLQILAKIVSLLLEDGSSADDRNGLSDDRNSPPPEDSEARKIARQIFDSLIKLDIPIRESDEDSRNFKEILKTVFRNNRSSSAADESNPWDSENGDEKPPRQYPEDRADVKQNPFGVLKEAKHRVEELLHEKTYPLFTYPFESELPTDSKDRDDSSEDRESDTKPPSSNQSGGDDDVRGDETSDEKEDDGEGKPPADEPIGSYPWERGGKKHGVLRAQDRKNWLLRLDHLRRWNREMHRYVTTAIPPKRIFVSYNQTTGQLAFDFLKRVLEIEHRFEVIDGFQDPRANENHGLELLDHISEKMDTCVLFLSIVTPDRVPLPDSGRDAFPGPSTWVVREEGMAISKGYSPIQWVHEDVDVHTLRAFDNRLYETFREPDRPEYFVMEQVREKNQPTGNGTGKADRASVGLRPGMDQATRSFVESARRVARFAERAYYRLLLKHLDG